MIHFSPLIRPTRTAPVCRQRQILTWDHRRRYSSSISSSINSRVVCQWLLLLLALADCVSSPVPSGPRWLSFCYSSAWLIWNDSELMIDSGHLDSSNRRSRSDARIRSRHRSLDASDSDSFWRHWGLTEKQDTTWIDKPVTNKRGSSLLLMDRRWPHNTLLTCCNKPFTFKCVGLFLLTRLRPERWLLFWRDWEVLANCWRWLICCYCTFCVPLLFSGVLWSDNVNVQIFSNDVGWTDQKHCGYWHSHRSYFLTELSVCSVTAKDWKLKLTRQHLPSLELEASWLFSVHRSVCCWEFHCRSIFVLSGLDFDHGHGVHTAIAPLTDVIYSRFCIAENWLSLTNCSRQVHSQQQYIH